MDAKGLKIGKKSLGAMQIIGLILSIILLGCTQYPGTSNQSIPKSLAGTETSAITTAAKTSNRIGSYVGATPIDSLAKKYHVIFKFQDAVDSNDVNQMLDYTAFCIHQENDRLVSKGTVTKNNLTRLIKLDRIIDLDANQPETTILLNKQPIYIVGVTTLVEKAGEQHTYSKVVFLTEVDGTWKLVLYGDPDQAEIPLLQVLSRETIQTFRTDDNPKAFAIDYKQSMELNKRGMDLYDQKNYKAAIHSFEEATKANPYYFFPPWNAACSYSLLNDKPNAVKNLEKAVQINKDMLSERIFKKQDPDLKPLKEYQPFQQFCIQHFNKKMP